MRRMRVGGGSLTDPRDGQCLSHPARLQEPCLWDQADGDETERPTVQGNQCKDGQTIKQHKRVKSCARARAGPLGFAVTFPKCCVIGRRLCKQSDWDRRCDTDPALWKCFSSLWPWVEHTNCQTTELLHTHTHTHK